MKRDIELLFELGTLRFVDRTWRQFLSPEFANVSEHMFRVAWIALLLARLEHNVHHEKILKLALVHDVSEVRAGDVNGLQKRYTTRDEPRAVRDTLYNTSLSEEMVTLWDEAHEQKTAEARIVKDADYLDQILELKEQQANGNSLMDAFKSIWQKNYGDKLYTKSAKDLLEQIRSADPHDWHVNARK